MNLDELEQEREAIPARRSRNFRALWDQASQSAKPIEVVDVTPQVFGAKDYIPAKKDDGLQDPRMTVLGPTTRVNWPIECNAVSGYWEMCERGTVGCTNHRRAANSQRFFRCYINHHDGLCRCSQPVIVDQKMLENAESAALHVLGALKHDVKSTKLTREDLDYLAIHVSRMMAHWARKALGHKPEDEK